MVADRLAEGLALLRVADRVVEARLRKPGAAGGDVDPADLDAAHEVLEPLADAGVAAEDARGRGAEAVEDELGRLDTLVPELLRAGHRDRQAGKVGDLGLLLEDEARSSRCGPALLPGPSSRAA